MEYEEAIQLMRSFQQKYNELMSVRDEFIAYLSTHNEATRLRSAFTVEDGVISAVCWDQKASTETRVIGPADGSLELEYTFFVPLMPEKCIWTFVLRADRTIRFEPSTGLYGSTVIGIDAPNLAEMLMLQLHGGVMGYTFVSRVPKNQ